jgi:spore coat protein A
MLDLGIGTSRSRRRGSPRRAICALVFAACIAATGSAYATSVEIQASGDNTLYQSATGAISNGIGAHMFVGRSNQASDSIRRGLVRFDVAANVPSGSTITAVTLHLYLSRTSTEAGARVVALRRALASWGEGTSNDTGQEGGGAASTTSDATWIHRFYNTQFWATPGGDFAAQASATTSVNAIGDYTWSGSGLVADAQAWLGAPATNFGWVLLGDESVPQTAKRFETRETNTVAQRPRLSVTFDPPSNTGACCASSGACTITNSATCSSSGGIYQGNKTTCDPNQCPQPTGACCATDGSCSVSSALACAISGGGYSGNGTSCEPNQCPQPTGACCLSGQPGTCTSLSAGACLSQGGTFEGIGSSCQVELCPYVDAVPRPAVASPVTGSSGAAASYDIAIQQIQQKLHRDLPATTLWGYGGSYPGPTIEAETDQPVTINWHNDLRDSNGDLRTTHLLPVDTCLDGPNTEGATPRTVTHLHGGHTPWTSDGYPEDTILPGETQSYTYPNHQLPATIWYHDHAMGITRLNVYLGLAGFFLVRDPAEAALDLPSGSYEVALAIQDRAIGSNGALQYPAAWQEDFFGDKILVNGKVWPYLNVDRGWYRFRVLNGSNSRTYALGLSNHASFKVIGDDGGLLSAPVTLTQLTLAPGERADLAIDFSGYAAGTQILLENSAPAPYPGVPGVGVVPQVMKFMVGANAGHTAAPPATLRTVVPLDPANAVVERTLELRKVDDACGGSAWTINGLRWRDPVTELPLLGTTEIWRFVNRSGMAHPMHLHLSMFQIIDRQAFTVVNGEIVPSGSATPPAPWESGWKDTVLVNAFEIVRVVVPFEDYAGYYPFHCHVLEHEDHDMMRQFQTRTDVIFSSGFEAP